LIAIGHSLADHARQSMHLNIFCVGPPKATALVHLHRCQKHNKQDNVQFYKHGVCLMHFDSLQYMFV